MAKLARVGLSDEEVKRLSKDLSSVFEYMEVLGEADTDGLNEIHQVNGLSNVFEEDERIDSECLPVELLGESPNSLQMNQIKVQKVI